MEDSEGMSRLPAFPYLSTEPAPQYGFGSNNRTLVLICQGENVAGERMMEDRGQMTGDGGSSWLIAHRDTRDGHPPYRCLDIEISVKEAV